MKTHYKVISALLVLSLASVWLACWVSSQWVPAAIIQSIAFALCAIAILIGGIQP